MKIQVISYDKKIQYDTKHQYTYSSLDAPKSLDSFDLNIISLQTPELWRYREMNINSIDALKDFQSLQPLLASFKKAKAIICFPQNHTYRYGYFRNDYTCSSPLKDMLSYLKICLLHLLPSGHGFDLVYENSTTICSGEEFDAAFYFENISKQMPVLTQSVGGEHTTTFWVDSRLMFTTLDLSKTDTKIDDFLRGVGIIEEKSDVPLWINEFKFLDDESQEETVRAANDEIERQKLKIQAAQEKLAQNLHYKTVLFETGDALVSVVFEILEKMLGCDLSAFVDKKDEDFRIVLEDVTFIGEIKGINSNVKSENVSQLDVHCQTYVDSLDEEGKSENVKGILIINPLKNKPLNQRDNVHEKQIQLARRNGSLIVTTDVLLTLFVAYLENHVSTEKVIELFKNNTGLLQASDFI